jgi:poly(3-hydroxybutyrate) depolymerase
VDEASLDPRLGTTPGWKEGPRWLIASSGDGPIDVKGALHVREVDVIAYAAAVLHVETAGRYHLFIGADDGLRVMVDGKPVFTRDEARPQRDDDDLIALDLGAGDHLVVLKLHQKDAGWSFHVRLGDASLAPPAGAYLALPGTTADDARELAAKMSWVSVDRGVVPLGYRPKLTVRFPEGAPRGVPLWVHAKLIFGAASGAGVTSASGLTLFDLDAGEAPVDGAGVGELVVALPPLVSPDLAVIEDHDLTYEITVAGRVVRAGFFPRKMTREAISHAEKSLSLLSPSSPPGWLAAGALESVMNLRNRLVTLVSRGDADKEAQESEARELEEAVTALDKQTDPYARRTGPMRRAYTSPVDFEMSEFGLYVPTSYRPGTRRTYPLIVALHGLNGKPMSMLRWVFGFDEPSKEVDWEDRHLPQLPTLDAFVVTPNAHGNTMYRDFGEDDVMRVIEWAMATYPIDPLRVTITGPSMGGIGTAAIAFHHPDKFAAAAPLCGYHSYFVRRDIISRPLRPWERLLAEERSNVEWAKNGEHIPLWIVHGTQDLPEANSGVLIDRYEQLKYAIVHDHPNLGHNVWQSTYAELRGAKWLALHTRDAHPAQVHFRTLRLRDRDDAWVHVDELAQPDTWGEVSARARGRTLIDVGTQKIAAFRLDRDEALFEAQAPMRVNVDGQALVFGEGEPLVFHRAPEGDWQKGAPQHDGPWKSGEVTGPIRDAFHAPLLFIYGADDPNQARVNEEVARAWANVRWGITVKFPMMSDADFFARSEPLGNDRALFLVGNAKSNRVVRALEDKFPIRIDGDAVVLGTQRFTGRQLGTAFIRPNPKRPDRYVVVIEGTDALGTWRSLSLPDLLPDFVVYDEQVAPSRGQMLLSAGALRAGGFFQNDWSVPANPSDPLAASARPAARSENDATPYLP